MIEHAVFFRKRQRQPDLSITSKTDDHVTLRCMSLDVARSRTTLKHSSRRLSEVDRTSGRAGPRRRF